jgi:Skp family chaperone for outer membrane proteins
MKKLLLFGLLVLVSSMMIANPMLIPVQAQSDTDTLLRLVTDAKNQVDRQLANIDQIPSDVEKLYDEGVSEVDALRKATSIDDTISAEKHFLKAMNIFKQITTIISSPPQLSPSSPQAFDSSSSAPDYESNLNRLLNLISTLKQIAQNHPTIDFSNVDRLVEQATRQIQENNYDNLDHILTQIKNHLDNIQNELQKHTVQATANRDIEFFATIIKELEENPNIDENYLDEIKQMLSEFEQLISDENYNEAKKIKQALTNKIKEIYNS